MKRRIITFILVVAMAAAMIPAALAVPGMNYVDGGIEFTVEIDGRKTTDELFWVGEEITLKSTHSHGVNTDGLGQSTEVWLVSYTDKIEDAAVIAAAGNERTYTFSQDVEGTFYYFHGALRASLSDPDEVYLSWSNPIKITTIVNEKTQQTEEAEPEEEPEEVPEQPEEEAYVFPFADVAETAWYYSDVLDANKLGLISGKSADRFCPDDSMTVAEAIKLAACLHQLYTDGQVTLENGIDRWYGTYVSYCLENGIISGEYDDYGADITRREFVHIFYCAMPESQYAAKNEVDSIPDVTADSQYADQIYAFYRAGILTGGTDGRFLGESTIKRSEVAAILTRMYDETARK